MLGQFIDASDGVEPDSISNRPHFAEFCLHQDKSTGSAVVNKRPTAVANRIRLLHRFLTFILALVLTPLSTQAVIFGQEPAPPPGPNIVLILADDLGYGDLGCYGQQIIKTPYLDQLAAEGIRFTNFYSGSPVCAPARCTLLTGKHTGHAWIRDNREITPEGQEPLPPEEVTVAELLGELGYATAAVGKWGLGFPGSSGDPNNQGFDLFYGYNCQRHAHNHFPASLWRNAAKENLTGNSGKDLAGETYSQDLFAAEALRFIRENKDRPFFLFLPATIPHLSLQVPPESLADYQGKIVEEEYNHTAYLRHPAPRAAYAAMISHLDRDVGRIVALLKELGIDEQTIVIFTSDNGPTYDRLGGSDSKFFRSAGSLRGLKGSTYEGGIRVPLIARWPGRISAGTTSDLACAFWDILPTVLDLAGAKERTPKNIDGLSMAPTIRGEPAQTTHDFLYWEFPAYGGQQAVRLGNWKGTRQNLLNNANAGVELYDLADDEGESRDVAADHPEIVARIEAIMQTARTPSEKFPFPPLDGKRE